MMLRKIFLPKLEVFLKNAFTAKLGLSNWSVRSKNFKGRQIQIRRLSGKDKNDKEEQKSKVKEYLKKAPSMQQRSQEQIKELRDLRVELIKERKILQKRLKENEKKIIQEKRRSAPNDSNAIAKYTYKLKMSRVTPKEKKVPTFHKSDGKVMQFQEFIQNFGKSLPDDQSTGERRVQYNNIIEMAHSKDKTPPNQPNTPNRGKSVKFDGRSFQKNAVGFAQRILHREKNNKTVAEASNNTSKETPNTKSKSNVDPKDARVYYKGHGKSQDILKPNQVISTVTKKDRKTEAFEKARAERNRKLKENVKGKPETSHLASDLAKKNVLIPILSKLKQNKENSKEDPVSIPFESRIKTDDQGVRKMEKSIKLNPKGLNIKDNAEKDESRGISESNKKKKIKKAIRVPIPLEPYDVLTQARRLQNLEKIKSPKKSISKDPLVNDKTPYAQLDLDPKTQFKAYVERIQQHQTQFKKGIAEPTQASSLDASKSISQSKLDLEKRLANEKNSDLKMNSDLAMMKQNIPPKILEQLKYAEIRNQKFLVKEIKDQLKRELEVAKNINKNETETTKKEIDLNKPTLGESGMEVASSKKIGTETCVNDIEVSAKMFLHSLEQFVQSLKADNNNNKKNNNEKK